MSRLRPSVLGILSRVLLRVPTYELTNTLYKTILLRAVSGRKLQDLVGSVALMFWAQLGRYDCGQKVVILRSTRTSYSGDDGHRYQRGAEHTLLKSARTRLFIGNRPRWSPQKFTVNPVPTLVSVTAVIVAEAPLASFTKPSCTMLTVPLTLTAPPEFDTKPTTKTPHNPQAGETGPETE